MLRSRRMWWLLSAALAGPCPDGASMGSAEVREALDTLWDQGLAGDDVAFRTGVAELEARIACLPAPLEPSDAARFHRNRALLAQRSGDDAGLARALASMRRAAPEEAGAWLADSDALAAAAGALRVPATAEFGTSLAVQVVVDGRPSNERPLGQPVVVQVFGADGALVDAAWLAARDPLPTWVSYPPVRCDEGAAVARPGALAAAGERAEAAFATLDVEGFQQALREVALGLPCSEAVLSPVEAAAIHRLEGVRLYTLGAERSALRSLQQARILDPLGEMHGQAVSEGSPLAALWARSLTSAPPPWVPVDAPEGVDVRVDGVPSRLRPATVPSIVQLTAPSGQVLWTSYVPAMAPLPALDEVAGLATDALLAPARQTYLDDEERRRRSLPKQVLLLSGTGLLVTSGLLWQGNRNTISDYVAPETAPERLEGLRQRANRTATASTVAGAAGALCLGVAVAFEL